MAIIEVNNVTKEFKLGQMKSFKQSFVGILTRLNGKEIKERKNLKALDDVTMSIDSGEVVGIIGVNGSGKSTLLKLISRITVPTKGSIKVNGSIAPLIEVGAGLHPELTGRENIYLNGSILGIPRFETKNKLDEIVSFAELEEFIDTPIKRYSSGMKVRLGFAIATSVEADILIVDEVLAVGDLAFQRKCFDKMENLIRRQGKTVLLVSHNIRQVERMCDRVILMNHGKLLIDGKPEAVCNLYYKDSNTKVQKYQQALSNDKTKIRTSGEVELLSIDILDLEGNSIEEIASGERLRVRIRFQLKQGLEKPEIVVGTHRTDFVYLTAGSTAVFDDRPDYPAGAHEIEYIVPSFPLVSGIYCIRFGFLDKNRRLLFHGETLKTFSVATNNDEVKQAGLRSLNVPTRWKMNGKTYDYSLGS
jgi:ABC-type polysaccharide/polyol phosphate transport system ATPase subunit